MVASVVVAGVGVGGSIVALVVADLVVVVFVVAVVVVVGSFVVVFCPFWDFCFVDMEEFDTMGCWCEFRAGVGDGWAHG